MGIRRRGGWCVGILLAENSKIPTPSTCRSKEGDKPQRQRISYLGPYCWSCRTPGISRLPCTNIFFTQDLELHLPMEGELLWPFLTMSQGHYTLTGQLHVLFPPVPCFCAVGMAGGPTLSCASCSRMVSIPGEAHPLPSLLPPFQVCGQSGGLLSRPGGSRRPHSGVYP